MKGLRDNQTVALFCVIKLKGDLGQSRHLMKRAKPGRGAKLICSPGAEMWFPWSLGRYKTIGCFPQLLSALYGHQETTTLSWAASRRKFSDQGIWDRKEIKSRRWGIPGGSVVKNWPANAGVMGSIPGSRRSHMPQGH